LIFVVGLSVSTFRSFFAKLQLFSLKNENFSKKNEKVSKKTKKVVAT